MIPRFLIESNWRRDAADAWKDAPCISLECPLTRHPITRFDSVMRVTLPVLFDCHSLAVRWVLVEYGPNWQEHVVLVPGTALDWRNHCAMRHARAAFTEYLLAHEPRDTSTPLDAEMSFRQAVQQDARCITGSLLACVKAAPKFSWKLLLTLLHGFLVTLLPVAVNFAQVATWLHNGGLA